MEVKLEAKYTKTKRLVVGENDLLTWCNDHGEYGQTLIKEWDQEKNGNMQKYKAGSDKVVQWNCSLCGESFAKNIRERVLGTIHGPCGRNKGKENLRNWHKQHFPYEKSLAATFPELLKEWDYERNSKIGFEPESISALSSKKVHWICSKCNHRWRKEVRLRTTFNYGCKKCSL